MVVFDVIHHDGGMVLGEMAGQLLLMVWTAFIGFSLFRHRVLPRWLAALGLATVPFRLLGQTELLHGVIPAIPSVEVVPLRRFEPINKQTGQSGSVQVSNDGHQLDFRLDDNGSLSTSKEAISHPAVGGPQWFGFILENWSILKGGRTLPVRMIVLKDKATYGFDNSHEKDANHQPSFRVTPSRFFTRMAIPSMRVTFNANGKTVLRYEGRVPPMQGSADKLKDLDARVEHQSAEAAYH